MRWHERHACRVRDALPPVLSSMAVDFTILDVIDAGWEVYTDNLETNGAGAATPCGGCAACQSRLVVIHEVGRDIEGAKCKWQPSANVLTLAAGTWLGGRGLVRPRRASDRRLRSCQGPERRLEVVLADKLADSWRQATHGAGRAAVVVIMVLCSSGTVLALRRRGVALRRPAPGRSKQGSWLLCPFWAESVIEMPGCCC
jgi:hypothetical protein